MLSYSCCLERSVIGFTSKLAGRPVEHVARTCQSLAVGHGRGDLVGRMGREPVREGRRACAAGSFDNEVSLAVNDAAVTRRAEPVEQGFRDEGVTWHTAPELLVTWQREQAPTGYYNLGVAHGVPGAIAMRGAMAAVAAPELAAVAAVAAPELAAVVARARERCEGCARSARATSWCACTRGVRRA